MFILLKFCFTIADNDSLIFLLKPTNELIGLATGSGSVYSSENGYFLNQLNIVINKSCAGFHFWMISFLMLAFLGLNNFDHKFKKIITIPLALTGAYCLTIFVNTSRILASIVVQHQADYFLTVRPHRLLHEGTGIIINLAFLILTYLLIDKYINFKRNNAKPTQS
jgi:exosortase K